MQHKRPTLGEFMQKPGIYLVFIFWFFYMTSMIYYVGRDKTRRQKMTRKQNRRDLAEIYDDETQKLDLVM